MEVVLCVQNKAGRLGLRLYSFTRSERGQTLDVDFRVVTWQQLPLTDQLGAKPETKHLAVLRGPRRQVSDNGTSQVVGSFGRISLLFTSDTGVIKFLYATDRRQSARE